MRNTAFLVFGIGLLVLQASFLGVLGRPLLVTTPDLLLPLIVFMGVHEYSLARGAALSFLLGYLLDIFAGAPIGLFTFISVATFVVARAAGLRLAAQTLLTKMALAFAFALVQGVLVVIFTAIFGSDAARTRSLAVLVPTNAGVTAIVAPLIFKVAHRIHLATIVVPRHTDGAAP